MASTAEITDFRADPSPVSLAILFDISGSMRVADRMLAARFAAHHVLSWLEPGRDEAALLTFDSRLHEVAPFTVDTRALQGALGEVDPFGATSLHDAIAEAAERAAGRTGRRRAVVVITDGIDTSSGLKPSEVSAHRQRDRRAGLHHRDRPADRSPGPRGHRCSRPEPVERDRQRRESRDVDRRRVLLCEHAGRYQQRGAAGARGASRQQYLIAFEPAAGNGLAAARDSDSGQGLHRTRAERLYGRAASER